jgi:tetratricopeptide (TPR) repeat protein
MNKNPKQLIISIAAVIFGFGLIFVLSNFVEKSRPSLPENYADEDLVLKGSRLKDFSLGYNGLIADWYWMQSLQYIGDKVSNSKDERINLDDLRSLNPRLLYPLLDTATDLDPQFLAVYSYGAVVLPAIDPEQAIKIAEKGIANNPNVWRFYQHLGFIYWRTGNYEKAAQVYSEGGKINGAPAFFKLMTAQMKTQGGSRETARTMYEQMYEEAQDSQTKEVAALRVLELDSLDERDAIRPLLEDFKQKNGRCPENWREVYPILRGQKLKSNKNLRFDSASFSPLDPTNIPYLLIQKADKCEVTINTTSSKIPVE